MVWRLQASLNEFSYCWNLKFNGFDNSFRNVLGWVKTWVIFGASKKYWGHIDASRILSLLTKKFWGQSFAIYILFLIQKFLRNRFLKFFSENILGSVFYFYFRGEERR